VVELPHHAYTHEERREERRGEERRGEERRRGREEYRLLEVIR
jgi:hypothetical protein